MKEHVLRLALPLTAIGTLYLGGCGSDALIQRRAGLNARGSDAALQNQFTIEAVWVKSDFTSEKISNIAGEIVCEDGATYSFTGERAQIPANNPSCQAALTSATIGGAVYQAAGFDKLERGSTSELTDAAGNTLYAKVEAQFSAGQSTHAKFVISASATDSLALQSLRVFTDESWTVAQSVEDGANRILRFQKDDVEVAVYAKPKQNHSARSIFVNGSQVVSESNEVANSITWQRLDTKMTFAQKTQYTAAFFMTDEEYAYFGYSTAASPETAANAVSEILNYIHKQ